jgi:hypothetical protein
MEHVRPHQEDTIGAMVFLSQERIAVTRVCFSLVWLEGLMFGADKRSFVLVRVGGEGVLDSQPWSNSIEDQLESQDYKIARLSNIMGTIISNKSMSTQLTLMKLASVSCHCLQASSENDDENLHRRATLAKLTTY